MNNFHAVHILADGMPIKLIGESTHMGDVVSGGVIESIMFQIIFDEFLKMAKASRLEFKIRIDGFVARPEELDDIKSLKDLILK